MSCENNRNRRLSEETMEVEVEVMKERIKWVIDSFGISENKLNSKDICLFLTQSTA